MFGNSNINVSQLLFKYLDKYISNELSQKYNRNFTINTINRSNYYIIESVTLYGRCNMTRKFRKMSLDTTTGMLVLFFTSLTHIIKHKITFGLIYFMCIIANKTPSFYTKDKKCMNPKVFLAVTVKIISQSDNNASRNRILNLLDSNPNDNVVFLKEKNLKLYIAHPFEFIHLSSMKYFNVHNKKVYKLQSKILNIGNVKDIMFSIWMVHSCCLTKNRVQRLIDNVDEIDWKQMKCQVDTNDKLIHNCTYHKLYMLDPYVGRWTKLIYRRACQCEFCVLV